MTARIRVGVMLDRQPDDLAEWLATAGAFDAAGADALWVDLIPGPDLDPLAVVAALAAVTYRSLLVVPATGAPADATLATLGRLSRDRVRAPGDVGEWSFVPPPESRAAWRAAVADAAERGVTGLLVPAGPRLLDLLRNPAEPEGRHDLHLAQG